MSVVAFHMEAAALARLINKTHFAMSNEETRYYLRGIHLHVRGDKLCAVATDGWQFARVETALPPGAEVMPPVTLPRENVGKLRKFLKAASGVLEVRIKPDERVDRIEFACGDQTFESWLLGGTYPDYERVIPTSNDRIAVVAKRPFKSALKWVFGVAPAVEPFDRKIKKVALSFGGNWLTISAGEYVTETVACDYSGDPIALNISGKHLMNVVSQIDGAQVRFEIKDKATPVVIKDVTDPSVLFMLMPKRD